MKLWFLRLFQSFRDLENARDSAMNNACESLRLETARAERLEDRLQAAYEDRQRLWDLVNESIRGERAAYQMHVNIEWQKQGRSAPFPDAPQMPEGRVPREVPNDIISRPLTMSERAAKGTQDFISHYANELAARQSR